MPAQSLSPDDAARAARPAVRLHVVTGKGGTGKTTVAAALALALARTGQRILLCEVEGRQGLAQLFDVPQLPYAEHRIAATPAGGEVWALAIEPKAALLEYLDLFYRLGRAGRVLEKVGAIDFATTIAPGVRDVLLTGKVYEAVRRRDRGSYDYDAVVLDAPPTGRIGRFLNVNDEVSSLARMGPIHSQAASIMTMMRSPATLIHLVTVLEDMPVQETQDAVEELQALGLHCGSLIVNRVRPQVLDPQDEKALTARSTTAKVRGALEAAGLGGRGAQSEAKLDALAATLLQQGREHAQRLELERELWTTLEDIGLPLAELGDVHTGIDTGTLHDLAADLIEQGVVAPGAEES